MFPNFAFPILFLKATIKKQRWIPQYVRHDGKVVAAHYAMVHYSDDHDDHKVASGNGSWSQKVAHKHLSTVESFHAMPVEHKAAAVQHLATEIQEAESAKARLATLKAALLKGASPKGFEWAHYDKASDEKKAQIAAAVNAAGMGAHMQAEYAKYKAKTGQLDATPQPAPEVAPAAPEKAPEPKKSPADMGKEAFAAGLGAAPVLNKEFMDAYQSDDSKAFQQAMKEYSSAWMAANLAAPVKDEPKADDKPKANPKGVDDTKAVALFNQHKGAFLSATKHMVKEKTGKDVTDADAEKTALWLAKYNPTQFINLAKLALAHAVQAKPAAPAAEPAKESSPPVTHGEANDAAAKVMADIDKAMLPDSNSNAKIANAKYNFIKEALAKGDEHALLHAAYGNNTYAAKAVKFANAALTALGSTHQVATSQKAGTHPGLAAAKTSHAPKAEAKAAETQPEPKANPEPTQPVSASFETKGANIAGKYWLDKGHGGAAKYQSQKSYGVLSADGKQALAEDGQPVVWTSKVAADVQAHAAHEHVAKGKYQWMPVFDSAEDAKASKGAPAAPAAPQVDESPETHKKPVDESPKMHNSGDALAMPDFEEGKTKVGPKAYYEKLAQKVIDHAKAGNVSVLQDMPTPQTGNSWAGKTANSKKLLALHAAALAYAKGETPAPAVTPAADPGNAAEAAQAEKEAPAAADDGPKEGDTKQGADGMLVLKDGHWHKVDAGDGAPASPFSAEEMAALSPIKKQHLQEFDAAIAAKDWPTLHGMMEAIPDADTLTADAIATSSWAKIYKHMHDSVAHLEKTHPHPVDAAADAAPTQAPTDPFNGDHSGLGNIKTKNLAKIDAAIKAKDKQALTDIIEHLKIFGDSEDPDVANRTIWGKIKHYAAAGLAYVNGEPLPAAPAAPGAPTPTGFTEADMPVMADSFKTSSIYKEVLSQALAGNVANLEYSAKEKEATGFPATAKFINEVIAAMKAKQGGAAPLQYETEKYAPENMPTQAAPAAPAHPNDALAASVPMPKLTGHNAIKLGKIIKDLHLIASELGVEGLKKVITPTIGDKMTIAPHKADIPGLKSGLMYASAMSPSMSYGNSKVVAQYAADLLETMTKGEPIKGNVLGKAGKKKPAKAVGIKARTGASASSASSASSAKPAAPQSNAGTKEVKHVPVSEVLAGGIASADDWTKTGDQKGSNAGGFFTDPDGVQWYVKTPATDAHVHNEMLANKLYDALGIKVPTVKVVKKGGKLAIASKVVPGLKKDHDGLKGHADMAKGFAADAWLANWDVIGLGYDNAMIGKDGAAYRVDPGGAMLFRAQGTPKGAAFGNTVTELDSLRDPKTNSQAASVFQQLSKDEIERSVKQVLLLKDSAVEKLVMAYGPGTLSDKRALLQTLLARKKDLAAKFPEVAADVAPKKHIQIAPAPNFKEWNGPGKGLSSKAHLNQQNQDIAEEMQKIATTGDLPALEGYKFQPIDYATGVPVGDKAPIVQHKSGHIQTYWKDLVHALKNPVESMEHMKDAVVESVGGVFGTLVSLFDDIKSLGDAAQKLGRYALVGAVDGDPFETWNIKELSKKNGAINAQQLYDDSNALYAKLTGTERQAIKEYTGSGFYTMNNPLTGVGSHSNTDHAIAGVDKASVPLKAGTVLSRKFDFKGDDGTILKKFLESEGGILKDFGLISTSLRPEVWSGNIQLRIVCGEGVKGCFVAPNPATGGKAISSHPGEDEVILPYGTKFFVRKVHKSGHSFTDEHGKWGNGPQYVVEVVALPNT